MPCTEPLAAAVVGALTAGLAVGGARVGWHLATWVLRQVSRRARVAAVLGDADQGVR